jgi:hypothetical protein
LPAAEKGKSRQVIKNASFLAAAIEPFKNKKGGENFGSSMKNEVPLDKT